MCLLSFRKKTGATIGMKTTIKHTNFAKITLLLLLSTPLCVFAAKDKGEPPVKVQVSGAPESLAENIKAFLPSLRNLKCDSSQRRLERFIEASEEKLSEGAEAMGYFESTFKMTSQRKSDCWALHIAVKPGKTVTVNKLDIQLNGPGKDLFPFQSILEQPPYSQGDVLISQNYEDFKVKLKRTANSLGFFDADLSSHTIRVNTQTHKADIELVFDTGKRYQIGKVTVEQEILDEKYLKRYLRIEEGDDFNSVELINQQRILEGAGYYQSVEVRADYTEARNYIIPVAIKAPKRKRYTYTGAIGFAADDGIYIETGMDTHWVNKKGHQLNITSRYSAKDPVIGLNYKIPLWNPEHEYANISAGWSQSDNDDIRGTALKLGFDYHRRNKSDWEQIASIHYLDEETEIDGEPPIHSQLTMLGLSLNKTKRNDALFPTKGWRVRSGLKGAAEGFLSDQTLLQTDISGKYLHTLESGGKVILQGEVGSTFIGDFDEMPKSLRYFAGGQNSIRGYSFESLGEQNDDGDVIGGRNVLTMSAEYEYPIKGNISAAAFVDAGNAFNEWDDYAIEVGYGVGVRYKSPLGPIRIDFAVPQDDTSDINFYFSLGPDL